MKNAALTLVLLLVLGAPGFGTAAGKGATDAKAPAKVLPFIQDDYPKALAEARAKKLPLFVETWAPW